MKTPSRLFINITTNIQEYGHVEIILHKTETINRPRYVWGNRFYVNFKSNGLDTGLKPNLGLKAAKYESVTHGTFLATVEINLLKEVFQRCCSHPNKKRDIHETP